MFSGLVGNIIESGNFEWYSNSRDELIKQKTRVYND